MSSHLERDQLAGRMMRVRAEREQRAHDRRVRPRRARRTRRAAAASPPRTAAARPLRPGGPAAETEEPVAVDLLGPVEVVHELDHDRQLRRRHARRPVLGLDAGDRAAVRRSPNSSRNAFSALRAVSMLESLNGRPALVRSAPDLHPLRSRSAHWSQVISPARRRRSARAARSGRGRRRRRARAGCRTGRPSGTADCPLSSRPRYTRPGHVLRFLAGMRSSPRVRARGVTAPPGRSVVVHRRYPAHCRSGRGGRGPPATARPPRLGT